MKAKLLVLALLMPMLAFAQIIDEKKARDIAASALKSKSVTSAKKAPVIDAQGRYEVIEPHLELHRVVKSFEGDRPCFYIFNQKGGGGGFAIVSNQGQLLAYSEHNCMDYDNAPENVKWLLGQYQKILSMQLNDAYPEWDDEAERAEGYTSLYRHDIKPMIGSEWHQDSPFNDKIQDNYLESGASTPEEGIVAGCTTIAMAQTMFYWKHPKRGTGTTKWKVGKKTYDVNFADPIDWSKTGPNPFFKPCDPATVADLCYRVAASLDSKVKDGETSANAYNIPKALTTYFDYDASAKVESNIFYSAEVIEDIAYTELENGRPCIIYGQSGVISALSAGHVMVIEGYKADKNLFFINMGWGTGGLEDDYPFNDYYALTVKNGYYFVFNVYQGLVTHIMPNQGGRATPQIIARSFSSIQQASKPRVRKAIDYDKNEGTKTYHVSAQIFSNDMDASIVTGVIAKDYVTGKECVFEGSTHNLKQNSIQDMEFDIDLSKIEYNGFYLLRPVFRLVDGDEWFTIEKYQENEEEVYEPEYVDVSNAQVLDLGIEVKFTLDNTAIIPGSSVQIEYNVPIKGIPMTYTSSDPSIVSVDDEGKITAHIPGSVTITAHCDDFLFNGNRLVKETTKEFVVTSIDVNIDHPVALRYFFPSTLESDDRIEIRNNIMINPEFNKPGFQKKIEYTLGFFLDGELVEKGYSWQGEWMIYNRSCQYGSVEYLSWHKDLADGEYELRLLYRIPDETPEGVYWTMPTNRENEAVVYMKLENGHATFRQMNRHPCELRVDAIHMSKAVEVGMQNTITVDVVRTSEMEYDGYSDIFCYVDGEYKGHEMIKMTKKTKESYEVNDFGYTYYFTPDHAGTYNIKIIDGRHHVLYDENIVAAEAKNYQLRVNKVDFLHSTIPNTANEGIQIELEIENIGEYRYTGDVVCRPISNIENENEWWPPRFTLDIAPGEIVKQILPMQFDLYFEFDERIFIKCYYTSNGKETILWKSEWLTYIDPETNGIKRVEVDQQTMPPYIFNLQGIYVGTYRQLNQLPSGLYIVGGKVIQIK